MPSHALRCALVCAVLFAGCGSSSSSSSTKKAKYIDIKKVESSIAASIMEQRHLKATVECPVHVPQQKGRKFPCIATMRSRSKPYHDVQTPFVVTIRDDKGFVTYIGK